MEKTVLICDKCKQPTNFLRSNRETNYKGLCAICYHFYMKKK